MVWWGGRDARVQPAAAQDLMTHSDAGVELVRLLPPVGVELVDGQRVLSIAQWGCPTHTTNALP